MKFTLRAIRVNNGYTLKEASEKLGISTVTLRSYETNKTVPTVKMMQKIFKLYNAKSINFYDLTEDNKLEVKE